MSRSPTKDRIYLALRDGASLRGAARALDLSVKTVQEHAADLVRRGVLERAGKGVRGAVAFKRGPKAHPYETSIPDRRGKDRVGSGEGVPKVGLRVHRGGYAFEVRGAVGRVAWSEKWTASGVANFALRDAAGNRFWLVQPKGAPARLMVQPTEEWVFDPREVASASSARAARVLELARAFVGANSFKFVSERAYQFQPVEFAAELPGLERFGTPGESFVWVDGSPGDGRLELETQDVGMAGAILRLPDVERELAEHRAILAQLVKNEGMLLKALVGQAVAQPVRPAPVDDPAVA